MDPVDALRRAFRAEITVPVRHHRTIPTTGGDVTLWGQRGQPIGHSLTAII
jgi:hypothetical protein